MFSINSLNVLIANTTWANQNLPQSLFFWVLSWIMSGYLVVKCILRTFTTPGTQNYTIYTIFETFKHQFSSGCRADTASIRVNARRCRVTARRCRVSARQGRVSVRQGPVSARQGRVNAAPMRTGLGITIWDDIENIFSQLSCMFDILNRSPEVFEVHALLDL
ncbi:hypothetical protein B0H13DRAFT_1885340 [Mycena leptocephala]|nr:hypothetical protein B0H13DRAFT_1885340 [Mycena leptocephala]